MSKHWLFLFLILLTGIPFLHAQQLPRTKNWMLQADTVLLDSQVIIRNSIKVNQYEENVHYKIDYYKGYFINLSIPHGTLLLAQWNNLSYNLKKPYQHKDRSIILPEFNEQKNPFRFEPDKNGFDPVLKSDGLVSNGSIMRGLSLGNNQNAVVNANLNLQLSGRINNDVDILAAISDENNPIQPEGNTQELQDFDQVFVQFGKKTGKGRYGLTVGDYLMNKPENTYFLNYYKKSRGLMVETTSSLSATQMVKVSAQAALSRGRFQRNIIAGMEGNQGPYRLSGANGEVFIIIISGTEAVYLDGERLVRGEQNDYTIDYNSGELVFMPRRLITQYSRIVVEFQYSDRNYARTVFGVNTAYKVRNSEIYLSYFTEQDNKNQPFQQNLTDSNKQVMAAAGDNLSAAVVSGATEVTTFSGKKILYRKTDSLGFENVYVYLSEPGTDTIFYEVKFSYTGTNKGNYIQGASGANGRVFQWVEPKDGIPQGDFEPVIPLIAPNRREMLVAGIQHTFTDRHSIKVEGARSSYDKNLYSSLDKDNDAGYALKVDAKDILYLSGKGNYHITSNLQYEFTSKTFRYIERYRNVEFNRIWNRQLNNQAEADSGNREHIAGWQLTGKLPQNISFLYALGWYNKNESVFEGWQQQADITYAGSRQKAQVGFENLRTSQMQTTTATAYDNTAMKLKGAYALILKTSELGVKGTTETSMFKKNSDTLFANSFSYRQGSLYLRSRDTTRFSYTAEISQRLDLLPRNTILEKHTLANEARASAGLIQKNQNRLRLDFNYRNFKVLDTAFRQLKPEQTLLTRLEYDYGFMKRLITANSYVQLGSGSELRRDYQYVEVPMGQGVYVWKDFNEDGIQQLNEFQPAAGTDKNLANYIKVYLPTTTMIRVNNSQFSQTLNINMFNSRRYTGWRKLATRFSDQAAWRFERKVLADNSNFGGGLFQLNMPDSDLISLASLFRNTLFFNRNNPRFGMDLGYSNQKSTILQTNGFESRGKIENNAGMRYNFNASWTIQCNYALGNKAYISDWFSEANYRYHYQDLKPRLSYQHMQRWRISFNYSNFKASNDIMYGKEEARVDELGSELRFSFQKIGVLNLKYSYYEVNYSGNTGTALAYDMLQGLSKSSNQVWGLSLQQRIGQNLQINFSYDGRKSGEIPVVHTGKMEARYLF